MEYFQKNKIFKNFCFRVIKRAWSYRDLLRCIYLHIWHMKVSLLRFLNLQLIIATDIISLPSVYYLVASSFVCFE